MQPFSFTKNSQPPNGFISYSEFVRPPSIGAGEQNRKQHMNNSSSKATSITHDNSETTQVSMKELFGLGDGNKINWQNVASSKQVM